jgi:hypothetical protein
MTLADDGAGEEGSPGALPSPIISEFESNISVSSAIDLSGAATTSASSVAPFRPPGAMSAPVPIMPDPAGESVDATPAIAPALVSTTPALVPAGPADAAPAPVLALAPPTAGAGRWYVVTRGTDVGVFLGW